MDNATKLLEAKKILDKDENRGNNFNVYKPAIIKTKQSIFDSQSKLPKLFSKISKESNNSLSLVKDIMKPVGIITTGILLTVGVLSKIKKETEGDIRQGGVTENVFGKLNFKFGKSDRSSGKVSENGLNIIKNHEGLRLTAYKPVAAEKYYTIGYGHYGPDVKPGQTITKEQAEELLSGDVARAEATVNKYVKVDITQNQFDALVSFCYNVGSGNFKGSTLLKKLNKGDYEGAAQEFNKWNKGSGKVLGGLVKRRATESALFSSDIGKEVSVINKQEHKVKPVQQGGKVGNYQLKEDVEISSQAVQYLKETGGHGVITSGLEGEHAGTASNPRSHYSGNKLDVHIRNMSDDEVIKIMLPFLKHPSTLEVAVEGFGNTREESNARMERIKNKILNNYPEIAQKIKSGRLKIVGDRRRTYNNHAHLDVLFTPKYLQYKNDYTITNKNEERAKVALQSTYKDKPKTYSPSTSKNKTVLAELPSNKTNIQTGRLGTVDLTRVYKNTNA